MTSRSEPASSGSGTREGGAGLGDTRDASGKRRRTTSPDRSEDGADAGTPDAQESPAEAAAVEADSTAVTDVEAALRRPPASVTSPVRRPRLDGHEDQSPENAAPEASLVKAFSLEELKERALLMFTGVSGGPRASEHPQTMAAVTVALLIAAVKAIDELMGNPKKPGPRRAEMVRCCVELDKEEARGWLVADAVGRPLLHRNDDRSQNDARDVGKRVLERANYWQKEIDGAAAAAKSAVRAAKRAAEKDASKLPGVADAEDTAARALAVLNATIVDVDLPAATSRAPRPDAYWRNREQAEAAAAAADKEEAELGRLLKRTEAARATNVAAKLKHESATARWLSECDRLSALLPSIGYESYLDATRRIDEPKDRAEDSYKAAVQAGAAAAVEYMAAAESAREMRAAAHGESDWPPGVLRLSCSERRQLLASWSVAVLADRFADEYSVWDLAEEVLTVLTMLTMLAMLNMLAMLTMLAVLAMLTMLTMLSILAIFTMLAVLNMLATLAITTGLTRPDGFRTRLLIVCPTSRIRGVGSAVRDS